MYEQNWPHVSKLVHPVSEAQMLPDNFVECVRQILPFCEDAKVPLLNLGDFGISTVEAGLKAVFDAGSFPPCSFRAEPLLLVAEQATHIDFTSYPKPCYFKGNSGLEGIIVGIRMQ